MGVFYETIPDALTTWIMAQEMFWVATAPLSPSGHVNVSPKGGRYFGIIDERTFWYLELTGSGIETVAHLHERRNGRITIMFSAFDGPPQIVRLWGKGRILENSLKRSKELNEFVEKHNIEIVPGTRSIIIVDVHQVGSSCGFSVPFYDFKGHRDTLDKTWKVREKKYKNGNERESIERYWAFKSAWSMDGLPGMKKAVEVAKRENIAPIKKMVGPLAPKNNQRGGGVVSVETLVVIILASFVCGALLSLYCQRLYYGASTLALPAVNATAFSFQSVPVLRHLKLQSVPLLRHLKQ